MSERQDHFVRPIARAGFWAEDKPDARNISTQVVIDRESVEVGLFERFGRRVPTRAEILRYRHLYPYGTLQEIIAPTGEFTLAVLSHSDVCHRKVGDTGARTVEEQINRFLILMVQTIMARRRDRIAWKLREREELRSERRRVAIEHRKRTDRLRVRLLEDGTRAWRRRRAHLAFLHAMRRATTTLPHDAVFAEWLAWAEERVGRSDEVIAARIAERLREMS